VDEAEKELLLEAWYIPISDRIRMEKEGVSSASETCRELRAHKLILEVLEW